MVDSIVSIVRKLIWFVGLVWVVLFNPDQLVLPRYVTQAREEVVGATASGFTRVERGSGFFTYELEEGALDTLAEQQDTFEAPPPATDNYQLQPHPNGQEGHYIMKNAPSEPMSTVDELNIAMNKYRQHHGLPTLSNDDQMCEIAAERAQEAQEEFSHAKFQAHVENGDYDYTGFRSIGENLFDGAFAGVHIVEFAWDQSPSHRPNMHRDWVRGCGGIYETTAAFVFAK